LLAGVQRAESQIVEDSPEKRVVFNHRANVREDSATR
jgi:hypothetical protein